MSGDDMNVSKNVDNPVPAPTIPPTQGGPAPTRRPISHDDIAHVRLAAQRVLENPAAQDRHLRRSQSQGDMPRSAPANEERFNRLNEEIERRNREQNR